MMFKQAVQAVTGEDEIILLADIVGGSPLTTSLNVLADEGKLAKYNYYRRYELAIGFNFRFDERQLG